MTRIAVIFLIFFAWAQMGASSASCPASWTQFGSYCYRSIAERKDWMSASSSCRSFGAELTSIHSTPENNFVYDLWSSPNADTGFWIGLSDHMSHDHTFVWSDHTPVDYIRWAPGEPNHHGEEHCVHVKENTRDWNDKECATELAFVCKKALE